VELNIKQNVDMANYVRSAIERVEDGSD